MLFEWKEKSLKSGIYQIKNLKTGKIYIGSAKEFKSRGKSHLNSLLAGKHHNKHLQASFNKWGSNAFVFEILEVVEGDRIARTTREKEYIDQYLDNWELCYNLQKNPVAKDREFWAFNNEEVREILSNNSKKLWQDPEYREKVVRAHSGKKKSPESKQKLSKAIKEKWTDLEFREKMEEYHSSPETKESLSKRYKERWNNKTQEEQNLIVERMVKGRKGFTLTEEHKNKISESLQGHAVSEETKQKLREQNLGKKLSKETRLKMSKSRFGKKIASSKDYSNIILVSPDKKKFTLTNSISSFAREHGLGISHLSSLLSGRRIIHKGWTVEKV